MFLHWIGKRIIKNINRQMKTDSGHYYTQTGEPMHFVPKKNGSGNRPTTIADAKKLGLLPSPTTVLKTLNKPALIDWLIRTAVTAVVTAPDVAGEGLDAKITRVLETEKQQDQESQIARDLGTRIHEAIEFALTGKEWDYSLSVQVLPVLDAVIKLGRVAATEKVVVGNGCAGRLDCLTESDEWINVVDFKTAKRLPDKSPWPEHAMQVGFYGSALGNTGEKRVGCTIIYISTTEPGQIAVFTNTEWQRDYQKFELVLKYWYLSNNVPMPEGML